MKNRIKDILIGILIGSLLMTATPVLANTILQKIDVVLNGVNVEVNGEYLNANSILYNGSTYLPLRYVAEAVGREVEWNQETMTANIIDKGDNDLNEVETNIVKDTDMKTSDGIKVKRINGKDYIDLQDSGYKYNDNNNNRISVLTKDMKLIDDFSGEICLFINNELVLESIEHISLGKFQTYVKVDYYENIILPLLTSNIIK